MRGQLTEVQRLRQANVRLTNENQRLRERVKVLEAKVLEQDKIIETITLQLEELKRIVFGKKHPPDNHRSTHADDTDQTDTGKQSRDPESYRRPVPNNAEVTNIQEYAISECPDCHTPLANIRTIVRYLEDILLPLQKTVEKQEIQTGFCPKCHKQCQAIPIPGQVVTLGPNVTQAVLYATYILRLSFAQTINWLADCYNLQVSQGEIAHMLETSSRKLELPYEQLKSRIRGSPGVHVDESTYQEQAGEGYVWVMTPTNSEEAVFVVGQHRGKANAVELLGEDFQGVRITDCYGGYKCLPGAHQVCWAHLFRYARELAGNTSLTKDKRPMCEQFYQQVNHIYTDIRAIVTAPFQAGERITQHEQLSARLKDIARMTEEERTQAPKKLIDLKERITTYQKQLLTCILYRDIPPDNNKAERKLRHIVLKRKISFGTRSKQGSQAFSINASVLLSLWWTDRANWFTRLSGLLGA